MGANRYTNPWTLNEVKVCLMIIKKNPDNLQHAFRLASEKINRTPGAIAYQYYDKGGNLYRFSRNRLLFSLYGLSLVLNRIVPKKFFGAQVKNNLLKGKTTLKV